MAKKKDVKNWFKKVLDTKDTTNNYTEKEMNDGKVMATLSYIIPLIPFFVEKKNKYVVYHAKQGMDLLLISIGYSVIDVLLSSLIKVNSNCGYWLGVNLTCKVTPWWIELPLAIIGCVIGAIAIVGIINAIQNKAKELPLVGDNFKVFAKK